MLLLQPTEYYKLVLCEVSRLYVKKCLRKIPEKIKFVWKTYNGENGLQRNAIGLYRENAIAIESEARDPFGGNVYYVTMQITFPIPEIARKEHNLHCDIIHVTTKWVSRLVLDHAIATIQTSR